VDGGTSRGLTVFRIAAGAGAATLATCVIVAVAALGLTSGGADAEESRGESLPSALAVSTIPARFLTLYRSAARRYGIAWEVLAGVGTMECDNGRDRAPACRREGAVNSAGAGGPMQFLATTWAEYGVDADGDGRKDRWDPADAIYAAARLLAASGAPQDYRRAVYAYNHAWWYVRDVLAWARRYRGGPADQLEEDFDAAGAGLLQAQTSTPVRFIDGARAELAPGDGHLALIPADAPFVVKAMIVAGNELQDLPYGPEGHPDPLGATAEDCSSTVNYVLYRAGIRPLSEIERLNPLAQSYVAWGDRGPGKWVSIYAADTPTPHVFMVIAGLRLDTSHAGTDTGPNRFENGPRWRIYGSIPSWAHWSVRHPPGL